MAQAKIQMNDEEFARLYFAKTHAELAVELGVNQRTLVRHAAKLIAEGRMAALTQPLHPARYQLTVPDGVVLVGSDAHYWPKQVSPAHRAFVQLAQTLEAQAIIMNGDAFDGASVSRHPPIGWENIPTVAEELFAVDARLSEIEEAVPGGVPLIWTLGNHDARFETRLATVAPEYAEVRGIHLKDHFPAWVPCWSVEINGQVIVKHRFKGGVHAAFNNTLWSGRSIITGHLHGLKVTPFSDYNGTRFGVECGFLAEIAGPQWLYTEDAPKNWASGFIVLTFNNGKLLWPEVVHVLDASHVEFRGEVIAV